MCCYHVLLLVMLASRPCIGADPVITTYSPSQGGTITNGGQNIVLTFDQEVESAGSGDIILTPTGGNSPSGGSALTIAITDTSQITFDSSAYTCTINPTNDLVAHGGKT